MTIPSWTRPVEYTQYLQGLPSRVLEDIMLMVERRWVDKRLPDRELLDALAHGYGVLLQLLADAHKRAAVPYCDIDTLHMSNIDLDTALKRGGRLPCMVTTLAARTAHYRVKDGSLVQEDEAEIRKISDRRLGKAHRKHGTALLENALRELQVDSALDLVEPYFEQAKRILQADKFHRFVVILCRGGETISVQGPQLNDRTSKYVFAQELARQVVLTGADGVLTIGEVWMALPTRDQEGAVIAPADSPNRMEALEVYAETSDGTVATKGVFFHKRYGRVVFGNEWDHHSMDLENNMLAPTRVAWATRSRDREQETSEKFDQQVWGTKEGPKWAAGGVDSADD